MMVHFNTSIQETEASRSVLVHGQLGLHKSSKTYRVTQGDPASKTNKN